MPPPLLAAELLEIVELEMVRVPVFLKAPPLPDDNTAPETVTPEMDKFPPELMVKILKLLLLPLMVRADEPRPMMVRVPAVPPVIVVAASMIVGSAEPRVMV